MTTEIGALVEALKARHPVETVDNVDGLVIAQRLDPNSQAFQQAELDLEQYLERPRRKRGSVTFHEYGGFSSYVNEHDTEGSARLWGELPDLTARAESTWPKPPVIVAVLNGDVPGGTAPGWGDHRAELVFTYTHEWMTWTSRNARPMDQVAFAELIEANMDEITNPAGADLLELVSKFEATKGVTFRSATVLQSGERQLTYNEEINATGAGGAIVIPREFELGLAPFVGSLVQSVRARLRYRINDGSLSLSYELVRPEQIIETAYEEAVIAISKAVSHAVWRGTPPESQSRWRAPSRAPSTVREAERF